jgi:hypothetical protein
LDVALQQAKNCFDDPLLVVALAVTTAALLMSVRALKLTKNRRDKIISHPLSTK